MPFVVPDRVPWVTMAQTLNIKFTSEVQTQHNLDHYNKHFLAQKIFDKHDGNFSDDFSNMAVTWTQFNKVNKQHNPFMQKLEDGHTHSNLTIPFTAGGPSRANVHFLAVV